MRKVLAATASAGALALAAPSAAPAAPNERACENGMHGTAVAHATVPHNTEGNHTAHMRIPHFCEH
jgi:hypothetical protein